MPTKPKYTLGKGSEGIDLTLPSGATCQARRPGVQGLIAAGMLDNFDQLTSLVKTEHIDKNTPRGIAAQEKVTAADVAHATKVMTEDSDKLMTALQLMDRLTAYVVIQPAVWVDYKMKDGDEVESDEDFAKRAAKAKADEAIPVRVVDDNDKMFLLNWAVGGSADLAAFRQGS